MNKSIFNLLWIGLFLVVLSACSKDTGDTSSVTNVPMTIESIDADVTVAEESAGVVNVNFNMDAGQIVDTKVSIAIDPLKTTATEGVDFVLLSNEVSIGAYARAGSFQVQINSDLLAEGDEVIALTVSGVQEPFGASNTLEYIINIKDYVDNTSLQLTFDWEGLGFYLGTGYSLCENVDMDFFVLDGAGGYEAIFDAVTGACPEVFVFNSDTPDGDYEFGSNMWANGFAGLSTYTDFVVRVGIDKPGVYNESFTPTQIWTSEDLDGATGGNGDLYPTINVNKAGTVYTVTQPDGTQIIQGLTAPPSHKLAQPKMKNLGE